MVRLQRPSSLYSSAPARALSWGGTTIPESAFLFTPSLVSLLDLCGTTFLMIFLEPVVRGQSGEAPGDVDA